LLAVIVIYALGVLVGLFGFGAGWFKDQFARSEDAPIVFVWPLAVLVFLVVLPFLGVYELGKFYRTRKESIYDKDDK
jgi:uncharacterized membrane protein